MMDIKLFVMDVDGTLTDGKVYIGTEGEVFKAFDIKDGYAIYKMLPDNGIVPVVITGRTSEIVKRRCEELGITEIHQKTLDKKTVMMNIAEKYGLEIQSNRKIFGTAFIGDDLLDIPALEVAEFSGCPNDAVEEVKKVVTYICERSGGNGAVREFAEWIIQKSQV